MPISFKWSWSKGASNDQFFRPLWQKYFIDTFLNWPMWLQSIKINLKILKVIIVQWLSDPTYLKFMTDVFIQVFFESILSKCQCRFPRGYNAQHCLITLIRNGKKVLILVEILARYSLISLKRLIVYLMKF